jgi:hypothetical protein
LPGADVRRSLRLHGAVSVCETLVRQGSGAQQALVWFENSAHMIYQEEPGRFLVHLVQDALPLAAAR